MVYLRLVCGCICGDSFNGFAWYGKIHPLIAAQMTGFSWSSLSLANSFTLFCWCLGWRTSLFWAFYKNKRSVTFPGAPRSLVPTLWMEQLPGSLQCETDTWLSQPYSISQFNILPFSTYSFCLMVCPSGRPWIIHITFYQWLVWWKSVKHDPHTPSKAPSAHGCAAHGGVQT